MFSCDDQTETLTHTRDSRWVSGGIISNMKYLKMVIKPHLKKMLEIFCVSMFFFSTLHIYNNYIAYPRSSSIVCKGAKKIVFSPHHHHTKHKTRTHLYTQLSLSRSLHIQIYISVFRFAPLSQSRSITTTTRKKNPPAQNSIFPKPYHRRRRRQLSIYTTTPVPYLYLYIQSPHTHVVRFQYKMLAVLPVPIINDSHKTENGLVWCVSSI